MISHKIYKKKIILFIINRFNILPKAKFSFYIFFVRIQFFFFLLEDNFITIFLALFSKVLSILY